MAGEHTRRTVLKTGSSLAAVGALAGCLGDGGSDDGEQWNTEEAGSGGGNGGENGDENGGENGGGNGDENGGGNGDENGGENGGGNGDENGGENGGDDDSDGQNFAGVGDPGEYTPWLYAPGSIVDNSHYEFVFKNDREIQNNETALGSAYGQLTPDEDSSDRLLFDQMGITYGEIASSIVLNRELGGLGFQPSEVVYRGEFDRDGTTTSLEDSGFQREGDHEGYTILRRDGLVGDESRNVQTVLGVGDGALILRPADSFEQGEAAVETVIDTEAGQQTTYTEASDDMGLLTDRLGSGTIVTGSTFDRRSETNTEEGVFEGEVASGDARRIDGQTTRAVFVRVFDSSDSITTSDIEQAAQNRLDDPSVVQDGRTVAISAELDTQTFLG